MFFQKHRITSIFAFKSCVPRFPYSCTVRSGTRFSYKYYRSSVFSFNHLLLCFDVVNVEIRAKNGRGNVWPVRGGTRSMRKLAHHLRRVKNETPGKNGRFSVSCRPRRHFLESVSKVRSSIPSSGTDSHRGVSSSSRENRASGSRH